MGGGIFSALNERHICGKCYSDVGL